MDKSYVPCILTELRFVISQMRILGPNRTYTNIPKEDVTTFLSRAIALIECLDDDLKTTESLLEETKNAYDTCKIMFDKNAEELRLTRIVKDAQKKVIDEKANTLLRLNYEIWELQEKAEYWEDVAKKYKANNPCNFCGNCRYCKIDPNEGVAVCTHSNVTTYWLDPDDASCEYFQSHQVDRDRPDQPCCKDCNRDNCNGCTLCPF